MKKTKVLAYLISFHSMSSLASYECQLKLARNDDIDSTIAEKTLTIDQGRMNSGNMGTLFVEYEKNRKKISLDINAVMSGWRGEEDATFVIIRRIKKRYSTNAETLSEILTVKGNDKITGWFDSYKLDISCQVKEPSPELILPEVNKV